VITTSTILKDEIRQSYKIPDYKLWEIPNGINMGKIKREVVHWYRVGVFGGNIQSSS